MASTSPPPGTGPNPVPPFAGNAPFAQGGSPFAGARRTDLGQGAVSAMSMKWSALHDAAAIVCQLAGLAPEQRKPEVRNFPAIMRDTGGWRHALASEGVDDLSAFMEPGLSALLAVQARGAPVGPAALALWHEFQAARSALLALVPPLGIRRPA